MNHKKAIVRSNQFISLRDNPSVSMDYHQPLYWNYLINSLEPEKLNCMVDVEIDLEVIEP